MNKIKLFFVANKIPSEETLHSLYTSVRFENEKIQNLNEDFKIWNDGRSIFIIMDNDKIENIKDIYSFIDNNKKDEIKIKLISQKPYNIPDLKVDDIVTITGTLCYTYKHHNQNKTIESCPINMKGKFKDGTKQPFLKYLNEKTGLNFSQAVESKEDVRFERLFTDEKDIYSNNITKKVLVKNIILVQATLRVEDPEITKSLFYKMIGKKKSYGFGNMTIEKYNFL